MGFFAADGVTPISTVLLRHLGRQLFHLEESFQWRSDTGQWSVPAAELAETDLASVPWFLRWLIPRYGRHLLPALLHDWMYSQPDLTRDFADDVFGETLEASSVPVFRRKLMVAAVTLNTRIKDPRRVAGIVSWFALFVVGTFAVLNGLFGWWQPSWWQDWFLIAGVLAPLPASMLWGRHFDRAIVAGYAMVLVAPATALILITQGVYWVIETGLPGSGEPIGTDEL